MCSQLALLKNDFELALMYSEIVPWPTDCTGWSAGDLVESNQTISLGNHEKFGCPFIH